MLAGRRCFARVKDGMLVEHLEVQDKLTCSRINLAYSGCPPPRSPRAADQQEAASSTRSGDDWVLVGAVVRAITASECPAGIVSHHR